MSLDFVSWLLDWIQTNYRTKYPDERESTTFGIDIRADED